MNTRDYKIFRPNCYYHIYNRGNNKDVIFLDVSDFLNFLKRLNAILGRIAALSLRLTPVPQGAFTILCYCLMPNHFHFLIGQNSGTNIDRLMARVCSSYSKYFNKKYKRVGHVFQDTFKAKLVDNDGYLTYLSAYIHNNPADPSNYDFSSYKDYLGTRQGKLCDKTFISSMFHHDIQAYQKFVNGFSAADLNYIQPYIFDED